jgi:hypothetical protein
MAVAAIISSRDKPLLRLLASGLRNITHQFGYLRRHGRASFGCIHRAVAIVVTVCCDSNGHQFSNDSAIDRCVGPRYGIANAGLAVRGEIAG